MTSRPMADGALRAVRLDSAADGLRATDLLIAVAGANGMPAGQVAIRANRVLQPGGDMAGGREAQAGQAGRPCLTATWQLPDGARVRGVFACGRLIRASAARP